jgi:hypothetical protein
MMISDALTFPPPLLTPMITSLQVQEGATAFFPHGIREGLKAGTTLRCRFGIDPGRLFGLNIRYLQEKREFSPGRKAQKDACSTWIRFC